MCDDCNDSHVATSNHDDCAMGVTSTTSMMLRRWLQQWPCCNLYGTNRRFTRQNRHLYDHNIGHVANLPSATWLMLQITRCVNLWANMNHVANLSATWIKLQTSSVGSVGYPAMNLVAHDTDDLFKTSTDRCIALPLILLNPLAYQ